MNDYMIYKVENEKINDGVNVYFLPERGKDCEHLLKRRIWRHAQLRDYKKKGYVVTSVRFVNKETYLNARLDDAVRDYCKADAKEQEEKSKTPNKVRNQTLEILHEQKMSSLKVIVSLMRRLMREDLNVWNEIAIQLYDRYLKF